MRRLALLGLLAACRVDTAPFTDGGLPYNKEQLDEILGGLGATVAFLDDCPEGSVVYRDASRWTCSAERPCPPGFAASTEETFKVCRRPAAGAPGLEDVMVKAGDFWIDRYEMSICPTGDSVGGGPGQDTSALACSVTAQQPRGDITWFQAAALCANAGKRLCSNLEWQVAALGTADPAAPTTGDDGRCATMRAGPRPTGDGAANCRSTVGAEDMIGNLWEWTGDWRAAGRPYMSPGEDGVTRTPWPPTFGEDGDGTSNLNGTAANGTGGYQEGAPAAIMRGGYWASGTDAGVFALLMGDSPSNPSLAVGARCCLGGSR